jgi:hypothetical protein
MTSLNTGFISIDENPQALAISNKALTIFSTTKYAYPCRAQPLRIKIHIIHDSMIVFITQSTIDAVAVTEPMIEFA